MTCKPLYIHTEDVHNIQSPEIVIPYILKIENPKSVIDVGCGIGTWLNVFQKNGIDDIIGIDGSFVDKSLLKINQLQFVEADLTNSLDLNRKFDLALCLEVAEHLPEPSADVLIETLTKHSDKIIFSAAIPGQGGQNHINEQWIEYWEKKFEKHGYYFHDMIRPMIWDDDRVQWWYRQNMFLVNKKKSIEPEYKNIIHPELYLKAKTELEVYKHQVSEGKLGVKLTSKALLKALINFFY